jgi:hypothetical protein
MRGRGRKVEKWNKIGESLKLWRKRKKERQKELVIGIKELRVKIEGSGGGG